MLTPKGAADRGATSGPALRREAARSKERYLRANERALNRETAKSKEKYLRAQKTTPRIATFKTAAIQGA